MTVARGCMNLLLWICIVGIAAAGALSGLWMKPDKKKKDDPPNITVIVPPQERHDLTRPYTSLPDAKRYRL